MICRTHWSIVEWSRRLCPIARRDAHLNASTHNKYTRVPTVARWKMGFRKARFRIEEQVRDRSDDGASFRFIQTGPRTIVRLLYTESQKLRKRVDLTFLIFSWPIFSRPSNLSLEFAGNEGNLYFISGQRLLLFYA